MKTNIIFLFPFILILLLSACKMDSLEAPIPGYLHIDKILVKNLPPRSDTATSQIVDSWVYINDQLLGSFELPTTIPIQDLGKVNLKIRGGILNNGISNSRIAYPFYEQYEVDTVFNPEEELKISPVVTYSDKTEFEEPWSGEDFESSINFENHPNSDTVLIRETDKNKVKKGNASGAAYLDAEMTFFEAYTPTFSNIPRGTSPVYLELDYKCTHDIVISVYYNNRSIQLPIVNLRAKALWNKVYVELRPVFTELSTAQNFNLAIGYTKPKGVQGELLIDNVKLLHF